MSRSQVTLTMALGLFLIAPVCPKPPPEGLSAARNAAKSIASSADDAFRSGRNLDESLASRLSSTEDGLGRYRKDLTSQDREALSRLRAIRAAFDDVAVAQARAGAAAQLATADAERVAGRTVRRDAPRTFLQEVISVTEDAMKELGCNVVGDALLPS